MKLLIAARKYVQAGLSVIPTHPETKRPFFLRLPQQEKNGRLVGVWSPYQQTIASKETLAYWFADGVANLAIVTGQISGNLVVFDFDDDAHLIFPQWQNEVGSLSAKLPVVRTGKGNHVYVRFPFTVTNQKLAYARDGKVRIETRGEGGYVQAPPSRHPIGVRYLWQQHAADAIPILTTAAAQHLLQASRFFNEKAVPTFKKRRGKTAVLPQTDADALSLKEERLHQYARHALNSEAEALGRVARGSRNDELNRSAFRMGRFVGCGLLSIDDVRTRLYQACWENRLIADDGERAFDRTFLSGIGAGEKVRNFKDQLIARVGTYILLL